MGSRVNDGHNALLLTFMEFDLDAVLSDPHREALWDLRAAATFLKDRLATAAVREEEELRRGSPEGDATEFEHAVLREEVGRFVREIEALQKARPRTSANIRHRLLRRVHRIELILAIHREGILDRAGTIASRGPSSARPGLDASVARDL